MGKEYRPYRQIKVDPKACLQCGKTMNRKRYGDRLEDATVFKRRKFCDAKCMAVRQIKDAPKKSALLKRAHKFKKKNCEMCGTQKKLQVHHLNGDIAHNVQDNIMTLCGSCHTKWHWSNGKTMPRRQSDCSICGMPPAGLGFCQKHLTRFKKYGNPLMTKKRIGSLYTLVQEVCGQPSPLFHE